MVTTRSRVSDVDGSQESNPHHHALFLNLLGWLPGLVMNPHQAACANGSKPYQQLLISRLGFRVAKTLITTKPQAARDFYAECRERVIYKSISAERSVVKRLTEEDLGRLEHIQSCPVQFQEFIPGIDFRVHVVGRRVFASQIETSSMDYRYVEPDGFRRIRAVDLPSEIQEKCVALTEGLGLVLAGIDLRRTMDGDYICFEVNTSPAFNFYEAQTGQRIGEAVAELLYRGAVEP
jgi:glutathione synthase/RimK-type ligase-like ATP-grasp enzyme